MLIGNGACTEGNSARVDHLANLIPGAGGYGSSNMDDNYDYILDDTPPRGKYFLWTFLNNIYDIIYISNASEIYIISSSLLGEVERLLKDYLQNQELVMNLGNRYYQVIYPIQMGRRELDTRDRRNQGYGKVKLI